MNFENFAKNCPSRYTAPHGGAVEIMGPNPENCRMHDNVDSIDNDGTIVVYNNENGTCCKRRCATWYAAEYLEIRILNLKREVVGQHKSDEHPYRCLLCGKQPNLYEVHEAEQVMIYCATKNCPSVSVAGNGKEEVIKSWNNVQLGLGDK